MGNYNYRLNQIIEAINRSSMRMVTLPQGSEVTTITDNSNNNDDFGIHETHDYHDEGEGVDIDDDDATEKIRSIIDKRNCERVSELMKKGNMTVVYHRIYLNILPPLFQFTNMTQKQLVDNLLIQNKRDNITPFCLLNHNHVRHVKIKKCYNSGHYTLRTMKVFMKLIKKHATEENCSIEIRIYWTIRDTINMWEIIGEKCIYAKYVSNSNHNCELSCPEIVPGMECPEELKGICILFHNGVFSVIYYITNK